MHSNSYPPTSQQDTSYYPQQQAPPNDFERKPSQPRNDFERKSSAPNEYQRKSTGNFEYPRLPPGSPEHLRRPSGPEFPASSAVSNAAHPGQPADPNEYTLQPSGPNEYTLQPTGPNEYALEASRSLSQPNMGTRTHDQGVGVSLGQPVFRSVTNVAQQTPTDLMNPYQPMLPNGMGQYCYFPMQQQSLQAQPQQNPLYNCLLQALQNLIQARCSHGSSRYAAGFRQSDPSPHAQNAYGPPSESSSPGATSAISEPTSQMPRCPHSDPNSHVPCRPCSCPCPRMFKVPCCPRHPCPRKKSCAQPQVPPGTLPGQFTMKVRTLSKCCRPQPQCQCNSCCPSRNSGNFCQPQQCMGSTNPFDNCKVAPILLVQGGRCQTIQISDQCTDNPLCITAACRNSTKSTQKKKKRKKSMKKSRTVESSSSNRTSEISEEEKEEEDKSP